MKHGEDRVFIGDSCLPMVKIRMLALNSTQGLEEQASHSFIRWRFEVGLNCGPVRRCACRQQPWNVGVHIPAAMNARRIDNAYVPACRL